MTDAQYLNLITTIYVIATIAICYFNYKSAKSATEQTAEIRKEYKEQNRPRIVIKFDIIRSGLLVFVIKNVGNMAATDLRIRVNDSFLKNFDSSRIVPLNNSEMYLAPEQEFYITIGGQSIFSDVAKEIAIFDLEYDGFKEEIKIDLNQYGFMLVYKSPESDIANSLSKAVADNKKFHEAINKNVKAIAEKTE